MAAVPHALFHQREARHYIETGKLKALDFAREELKPEFAATCRAIAELLDRFEAECDTEMGFGNLERMNNWIRDYLNEYLIQQEGPDLYKVAYGFGLAFAEYLGRQQLHPETAGQYRELANVLIAEAMNVMLDWDAGAGLGGKMYLKLCITGCRRNERELYGRFGVYSIFKNCAQFWLLILRARV